MVAPRRGRLAKHGAHLGHAHRVQAGERLVEDQHLRAVHQGGGQLHPLLVAVRERVDPVARPIGQAELLQPGHRGGARLAGASSRPTGRSAPAGRSPTSWRRGRAPRACTRTPAHTPDPGRARRTSAARVGVLQVEDDAHRGGLARTVAPEEAQDPTGLDRRLRPRRTTRSPYDLVSPATTSSLPATATVWHRDRDVAARYRSPRRITGDPPARRYPWATSSHCSRTTRRSSTRRTSTGSRPSSPRSPAPCSYWAASRPCSARSSPTRRGWTPCSSGAVCSRCSWAWSWSPARSWPGGPSTTM